MIPLLAAGLSAGASLLSGLGASSSARSQQRRQQANDEFARTWNQHEIQRQNEANRALGRELLEVPELEETSSSVDIETMMADAQRAGFNPVTWLQSGALAAYSRTASSRIGHNAVAAFQLMSPEASLINASQAVKIPSALEAVGDAATSALSAYRAEDKILQSQDFQRELLGLQLDAIQRGRNSGRVSMSGLGTPSIVTNGTSRVVSNVPGMGSHKPEVGESEYTNPHQTGPIDTTIGDAGNYNKRYGDEGPPSWYYGLEVWDRDLWLRNTGKTRDYWWNSFLGSAWNPLNPAPNYGQRNPGYDQPYLGTPH